MTPGVAFVSDEIRKRYSDDTIRRIMGLSDDAEISSPRDFPDED